MYGNSPVFLDAMDACVGRIYMVAISSETRCWLQRPETELHIYRYGGEVDQFRGDGLVAFFGATQAHEDDPERAVLAALAMQAAIQDYAAELSEKGIELLDAAIANLSTKD